MPHAHWLVTWTNIAATKANTGPPHAQCLVTWTNITAIKVNIGVIKKRQLEIQKISANTRK